MYQLIRATNVNVKASQCQCYQVNVSNIFTNRFNHVSINEIKVQAFKSMSMFSSHVNCSLVFSQIVSIMYQSMKSKSKLSSQCRCYQINVMSCEIPIAYAIFNGEWFYLNERIWCHAWSIFNDDSCCLFSHVIRGFILHVERNCESAREVSWRFIFCRILVFRVFVRHWCVLITAFTFHMQFFRGAAPRRSARDWAR